VIVYFMLYHLYPSRWLPDPPTLKVGVFSLSSHFSGVVWRC